MLGFGQLVLIALILLIVMGPTRLLGMGPALGKAIRGFKKGLDGADEEEEEKDKKVLAEKEKDITPPKE